MLAIALGALVLVAVTAARAGQPDARPLRFDESARPAAPVASGRATDHTPSSNQRAPAVVRVVALGDSVTAGTSCDCRPFPELYAGAVADTYHVHTDLDNRGVPGQDSSALLDDVTGGGAGSVADADVVLLTIGANDFAPMSDQVLGDTCGGSDGVACAAADLSALHHNLQAILGQIARLRHGKPTAVLVTGYWNVYEDGEVADRDYSAAGRHNSDLLTRQVNSVIAASAAAAGAQYVDLYVPFHQLSGASDPTRLLADDGDHPSASGHQVIAHALLAPSLASIGLR